MPRRQTVLLAAPALLALLASACEPAAINPEASFAGASIAIEALGLTFTPDIVTAPANVPVRLVLDNADQGVSNDLHVFQGDSELGRAPAVIGPGYTSVVLPPLAPGRYQFASTTQPDMIGTLIVAPGAPVGPSGPASAPPAASGAPAASAAPVAS